MTSAENWEILFDEWNAKLLACGQPTTAEAEKAVMALGRALLAELFTQKYDAYTEALIFYRLSEEYLLTAEDIAAETGRTKSSVCTSLRLLDLPEEIKVLLQNGEISTGHCRSLLNLRDKKMMLPLAQKAINRHLSVRETGRAVKAANAQFDIPEPAFGAVPKNFSASADVTYQSLEKSASEKLGRRLKIQAGKRRNILTLEFYDEKDLRSLLATLCGDKAE